MPGPNGPSLCTVGGTTSQPEAFETRYADTSRPASVPCGKSQSGRSPATGLYTQAASRSPSLTMQYRVAFDASASRPATLSWPALSSSIASSSLITGSSARLRGGRRLGRSGDRSVAANPVSVLARADVAGSVQRQSAERGPPAGGRDARG